MTHGTGLTQAQRLKTSAGIWYRTCRNAGRLITGGAVTRTEERVRDEYVNVGPDWNAMGSSVLVRRNGGLDLVTYEAFREQYVAIIVKCAEMIGARRILEVGCGEGLNIGLLQGRTSAEVHGFDLVPNRIARARARLPAIADRFWVGDATVSQVPNGSFDIAYSCHAVEQMQGGWRSAVSLMRDAAPYVLLMEPFYERKDVHGKMHSRVNGYFRGSIADVLAIGLAPVCEFDIPLRDIFNQTSALLLKHSGT